MSIEDGPGDTLDQSESLDSDEIGVSDGDDVVTPPDHWVAADKFGTTGQEEHDGESLDQKLAEEEPDLALDDELEIPVAATADDDLTEDLVDTVVDSDDEAAYLGSAVRDDDAVRDASVVDGTVVESGSTHRGQIDGSPEDAGSFYE